MVGPKRRRVAKKWRDGSSGGGGGASSKPNIKDNVELIGFKKINSDYEDDFDDASAENKKTYLNEAPIKYRADGKGYSTWKRHSGMSEAVKSYLQFLRGVSRKTLPKRTAILKEFSDDRVLFDALSEISHNLLKGNIKVNKNQFKRLKKHTPVLKALDCPKTRKCSAKRRKLIEQSGGFLPFLIPAAAVALGELGGVLLNKLIK